MSMWKKNLNWLYAFVFVITRLKFDLKKTWKVDFLVYPIWYRCVGRDASLLQYGFIKSYVASYNLKELQPLLVT